MSRFRNDYPELELLLEKAGVPLDIQIEIIQWLGQHDSHTIDVCRQAALAALEKK